MHTSLRVRRAFNPPCLLGIGAASVFFGAITYVFWLVVARHYGNDADLHIPWFRPLVGMLYSNGINHWMDHNIPLWFLTCLLLTETVFSN